MIFFEKPFQGWDDYTEYIYVELKREEQGAQV